MYSITQMGYFVYFGNKLTFVLPSAVWILWKLILFFFFSVFLGFFSAFQRNCKVSLRPGRTEVFWKLQHLYSPDYFRRSVHFRRSAPEGVSSVCFLIRVILKHATWDTGDLCSWTSGCKNDHTVTLVLTLYDFVVKSKNLILLLIYSLFLFNVVLHSFMKILIRNENLSARAIGLDRDL